MGKDKDKEKKKKKRIKNNSDGSGGESEPSSGEDIGDRGDHVDKEEDDELERRMLKDGTADLQGFVVDSDDEEEDEGEAGPNQKKRKKKMKTRLAQGDLELVQEHTGIYYNKKTLEDEEEGDDGDDEDDAGRFSRLKRSRVRTDGDAPIHEPVAPINDGNISDDSEASFIVDDSGAKPRRSKEQRHAEQERRQKLASQAGVSEETMSTARQIFYQDEDYMSEGEEPEIQLKETEPLYGPTEMEENYMTDRDTAIKKKDLPERFQVEFGEYFDVNVDEESEVKFVTEAAFPIGAHLLVKDKVRAVLKLIHENKFDIPFIARFRKEAWGVMDLDDMDILSEPFRSKESRIYEMSGGIFYDDLWGIYDKSLEYRKLARRREILKSQYAALGDGFEDEVQLLFDEGMDEMADMEEHLRTKKVIAGGGVLTSQTTKEGYRMPMREDTLSTCVKGELGKLLEASTMTPEQLGSNLFGVYAHAPPNPRNDFDLVLEEYVSDYFPTADAVKKGLIQMGAVLIAAEPRVRHVVKKTYQEYAILSVAATAKGRNFDPNNKLFEFVSERAADFCPKTFLELKMAQQKGNLTFTISVPADRQTTIFNHLRDCYISDLNNTSAQRWNNEIRMPILTEALTRYLYPVLARQVQTQLENNGKRMVLEESASNFYRMLNTATYGEECIVDDEEHQEWHRNLREGGEKPRPHINTGHPLKYPKVMAIYNGRPAYMVLINEDGQLHDSLELDLMLTTRRRAPMKPLVKDKIKDFILRNLPHVIAVGATGLEAATLVTQLQSPVQELVDEQNCFDYLGNLIEIVISDIDVARIFSESETGRREFPGKAPTLLRAISIARRLQDPTQEILRLAGQAHGEELLKLALHPLQGMVGEDERLLVLQRAASAVVNKTGVDLNRCSKQLDSDWQIAISALQFVAGLGPRKADDLLHSLTKSKERIQKKEDLKECLGDVVWTNASGMLKLLKNADEMEDDEDDNTLDRLCIHPERFEVVQKLCCEIMQVDEGENNDEIVASVLRPENRREVDSFNFEDFLISIQAIQGNILPTLFDIKRALKRDLARTPFQTPTPAEEFRMLIGDHPDTLVGQVVTVTPFSLVVKGALCELENKMLGDLKREDAPMFDDLNAKCRACSYRGRAREWFSENRGPKCPAENCHSTTTLPSGDAITCVIKSVDVETFTAILSAQPSDLPKDPDTEKREAEKSKQVRPKFIPRPIDHPNFKNVSLDEAMALLGEKDPGEFIIRPSSRGTDHLSVTWKLNDNLYAHIMIEEKEKGTEYSIGRQLWIGENYYEDLDEMIATHIEPLIEFAMKLVSHDRFRSGSKSDIEEELVASKSQAPGRVFYLFGYNYDHPGAFTLYSARYVGKMDVSLEHVSLTPHGFKFRNQKFSSVERVIAHFKTQLSVDPRLVSKQPAQQQQRRPQAAPVPAAVPPRPPAQQPYPPGMPQMPYKPPMIPPPPPAYGAPMFHPPPQGGWMPPMPPGGPGPGPGGHWGPPPPIPRWHPPPHR